MKNVKIIIGANFGDEGKGLMTDYICSRIPSKERVLNVRFNGGVQSGHTVIGDANEKHIFGHFGSGSFLENTATYLSKDFVVNPSAFRKEYNQLKNLAIAPMVYCHPKCLITFPQDMLIDQFIVDRRKKDVHGTRTSGLYETILRSKKDSAVMVETLILLGMKHSQIDIDYYTNERIEKIFGITLTDDEAALLNNQWTKATFDQDLKFFMDHVSITDEKIFKHFDNVVFEGSDGLMTDQENSEYFPYVSVFNTGVDNVVPYLDEGMNIEAIYVSRPYLTKSWYGDIPNECKKEETGAKANEANFRYGKLNIWNMMDRCQKDFSKIEKFGAKISYAVTHMDEVLKSDLLPCSENLYLSYGPARKDVKKLFEEDDA